MTFKRIYAIFVARNWEYFRDKSVFGWNFIFPVVMVVALSFAFDNENQSQYTVGVVDLASYSEDTLPFLATDYVKFVNVDAEDEEASVLKVERHRLDMLLSPAKSYYWINEESPSGYLAERVLLGSESATGFRKKFVTGKKIRYIDWAIPGILAMNMMFSALWGIGYVIVRYRKTGFLKRLRATPVNAVEFLMAQTLSRIWVLVLTNIIIFVGLDFLLDFQMHGSYAALFFIFTLGGICLLSMGLIIASRVRSEELAGGMLNLVSWPMMFLSEFWFSLEGAHPWMQKLAQIFPLTHMTNAARAVMIDGASFWEVRLEILILMVSSAVMLAIGAALFRWE